MPRIRRSIIHRADEEYPFLHDTMIAFLGGRLLCAWYNSSEDEIQGKTVIRGRWSEDLGRTWSAPELIAQAEPGSGLHMVPAVFSGENGEIFAYITEMTAHDRPAGYRTYRYEDGAWTQIARHDAPVLFNTQPVQTADGRLLCAGRMSAERGELPLIPCVMSSDAHAPAGWGISPLPGPWLAGEYPLDYPETTLIPERTLPAGKPFPADSAAGADKTPAETASAGGAAACASAAGRDVSAARDVSNAGRASGAEIPFAQKSASAKGARVTAITRSDCGPMQVFESCDGGRTWTGPADLPLPVVPAKLCGGTLACGVQYLIYNEKTEPAGRSRLVIALRKSSDAPFTRALLLFDGRDESLDAGPYWHYPCAAEHEGHLYISCTSSRPGEIRRHAALVVVPVEMLIAE